MNVAKKILSAPEQCEDNTGYLLIHWNLALIYDPVTRANGS